MAFETKQVALCIKKILRTTIRKGYRCVFEHPILFSLGVLLFLLYRSSPGFFAFLLSSSPVIVCTTILLGILLSYGDTNLPEVDEDNKITPVISAFEVGNSSSDIHTEENQSFTVPEIRNSATDFKERETKHTVSFRERAGEHVDLDDDVPLLRRVDEEYERFDRHSIPRALTPFPSMTNFQQEVGIGQDYNFNQEREWKDLFFLKDKADRHTSLFEGALSGVNEKDTSCGVFSSTQNVTKHGEIEERQNQERVLIDLAARVRNISEEKPMEGVAGTSRPACAVSVCQSKKLDEIKIDTSKAIEDNLLDSSLGSPWARVGSQDGSSGFDSDQAESSSPDASMTDIAPVLDEIDPLLGADSTRPNPIPKDGSDTDSHVFSHDHQTDDESNDEIDHNDAKDNVEEKKKDDAKEAAFIWTADDEKNVMDLGYSEMERNRRLEILMARRRSRKNIRFDIDNNLIDIDSNDAGRSIDDLSRFRIQVPHISVPRRNPFDLPYDPEEAAIPGSAPSILHTRKNPFDLPVEKSSDSDNLSPEESVKTSHQDIFFRRHDSFNFGSTDATQERCYSRFKPYFAPESVEGSTNNFQRQFSDKSESKLSSVTESDMTSSVANQEDHKGLDEKDSHEEHGSSALPRQDSDLADAGSECSDGINSVDVELDHSDIDDRELALQHFVFERSREREAYLASTIGKGHEEDYMLKLAGNSMKPPHPVADLLSWEDGDGESSLGAISSLEPNTAVEFSEWISSPRPAEEQSRSGDLQEFLDTQVASTSATVVLGASNLAEQAGNVDSISYSNNEMPLDNLIHGSMELPSEFGTVTLPVISRDLHPIPEETVVENFNMQEKHESVTFTDATTALTGLHVIEEHFDVGSEGSPSSAVVSSCPQESHSIQSPLTEPANISNPFFSMAAEHDKVNIVEMKEERAVGYLFDSDDEADKIYPEPIEDNGIDEIFLSELDAVGDFRVEPMRLDQQVPDPGTITDNHPANGVAANSLISPQTSGNISLTMSDASALDSGEQSPLADDLNVADPEFGWSLRASHDDPEQTVYNPRRRILETSPFEAMNAELKLSCDDDTEVTSVATPSASNLAVGSSEQVVDLGTTETDSQMVILDARSLEDIETALKQVSDGVVDKSTLDNETSMVSSIDTNSEPLECAGQLHVIDAKSVEDIYDAFKEQAGSVAVANSSLEESEDNDECGGTAEFTDKHLHGAHVESLHIVGDDREPEPTTSNMTIEAKTLDDIDAVFKKLSDASAKSTVDAMESENACERGEQSKQQ